MGKIKVDGKDIGKETDKREWERDRQRLGKRQTDEVRKETSRRDWERNMQTRLGKSHR